MDLDKVNEVVLLRNKRERIEEFLKHFKNDDGNAGVVFYSDVFKEILYTTFHDFEDLQNEFNDFVKTWAIEKIEEIDNTIKSL